MRKRMSSLLLNCDLGESFGAWTMGMDEAVMPHIDQANIACGFHAGDHLVIQRTLRLAAHYGVMVGAHPGYPDLAGFGRRSISHTPDDIMALMHYQISALDGMAKSQGLEMQYVKPHGALYNDMMADKGILETVMQAVSSYAKPLKLMLLATNEQATHLAMAEKYNLPLLFEAFADRLYTNEGRLTPRSEPNAVHDKPTLMAQVEQLLTQGTVTTGSGSTLELRADTLCVHGDNEASIALVKEIKQLIDKEVQ